MLKSDSLLITPSQPAAVPNKLLSIASLPRKLDKEAPYANVKELVIDDDLTDEAVIAALVRAAVKHALKLYDSGGKSFIQSVRRGVSDVPLDPDPPGVGACDPYRWDATETQSGTYHHARRAGIVSERFLTLFWPGLWLYRFAADLITSVVPNDCCMISHVADFLADRQTRKRMKEIYTSHESYIA